MQSQAAWHTFKKRERQSSENLVKIWAILNGDAREGKKRKPEVIMGSPGSLSTSCTTFKTPPKHKDAKIWKVLSKCKSGTVHQVLFLCTNSCFPSISRNLRLAASHSSLGEMTSLIERPTTSCSTSTTSTEIQATSTSTSATSTDIMLDINRDRGDINGDICADTIELSQASWHCTSHIKCWWVGSSKGLTETDFCWWQLFSSCSSSFSQASQVLFSNKKYHLRWR